MKQTNSAIKFLMAQYRAIFNNAYFKGLASAAIVTVAMAAGQAQAASGATELGSGDLATSTIESALKAESIVTKDAENTLTLNASNKYVNGITVTKDTKLTVSGDFVSVADVAVNGTLDIAAGKSLLLASTENSKKPVYDKKLTVNSGAKLTMAGNIGAHSFNVSEATLTLSEGGTNGTNLTAHGERVGEDAPTKYDGQGTLTKVTATLGDASNITAIGKLDVNEGTIKLNGNKGDLASQYYNLTFLEGSRNLNINKANINVSGGKNALSGRNIVISNGAKLSLADSAALTIGTDFDVKAFASDTNSGSAIEGNIAIKDSTVTLGTGSTLNFGYTDSAASVAFEGKNTIANKGTVNFYTPKMSMGSSDLTALIGGNVDFKSAGELTLTDDSVNLSSAEGAVDLLKDADGSLKDGVTLSEAITLKAKEVVLGKALAADKLTVDAGVVKVTPSADEHKKFDLNNSNLVALKGLTSATTDNVKTFNVSGNSTAAANLTLGQDASSNGSVTKIDAINVSGATNSGTLTINGQWSLNDTALTVGTSGAATLNNANVSLKGLTAKEGEVSLDASSLKVTGGVDTADNKVSLANNSTLTVKHGEAFKESQKKLNKVKADGTSTLVLSDYSGNSITFDALKQAKTDYLSGSGLIKITDANGNQVAVSGETGITPEGTVTVDKALAGAGLADIYDKATVTGVTSAAITTSNDWGAAQLDANVDALKIGAGTVTLNGVQGSDNLVSKSDKTTAAGVALEDGSTLNVQGKGGTIDVITASADDKGKVLVGASLKVNKDIGTDGEKVSELTVQANGSVVATNAFINTLNVNQGATLTLAGNADTDGKLTLAKASTVDGTVIAKAVSAAENLNVNGNVKADSLAFSVTGKTVFVGQDGENSASGILDLATLNLNGGSLIIDPEWKDKASLGFVGGAAKTDIVTTGGKVGVGKNAAFVAGMREGDPAADAILARYTNAKGSLDKNGNNALDADEVGALFIANKTYNVESGKAVIVDPNKTSQELNTALTSATNKFDLGAGAALVVTDELTESIINTSGSVINFAATGTLTLAQGSKVIIDGAITAKDKLNLVNTGHTVTNNGKDNILIGNGFFTGNLNNGQISFAIDKDKVYAGLYNQSTPVKDLTFAALEGKYGSLSTINDNVKYIIDMSDVDGGKSIEGTANLAVYGGAVQGTALAQQAANDAVSERMSRSNPNGSLVFANNAQGGGLWLSPVYKSHESDSFDADGVDYGVDGDLTGLVLGADSTSESGVRVGGYFNFGSASFDGQGVGDQVSNDADYFGFGLYAGMTAGQFSLLADAGFTQVSNDIEQSVNYKDYSKVKADVDSTAVTLGLRGEYKLNVATMDVTPHLGVRYTRLAIDSYDAKMNGYVLASSDFDTMQMFSIPFGVTVSKDIAAGAWTIKPVFDLTLTANAGDTDAKLNTIFPGSDAISITSEAFDSFTYGATFGLDAKYGESFSIGLNTNYTGSSNADEFGVMGNARYMF